MMPAIGQISGKEIFASGSVILGKDHPFTIEFSDGPETITLTFAMIINSENLRGLRIKETSPNQGTIELLNPVSGVIPEIIPPTAIGSINEKPIELSLWLNRYEDTLLLHYTINVAGR